MKRSDDDDYELFRAAMEDVVPLQHDKIVPATPRVPPVPRKSQEAEQEAIADLMSDAYDPEALETGEELSYQRPGVQHRVMRRLRRGQYSLASELDLHGMTVPLARQALAEFLHKCRLHDYRCVRI